jgi:hypothetical protein
MVQTMRVMVLVKATEDSEQGILPATASAARAHGGILPLA